ncbi:hypothetical protein A1O3_05371 [Capronia epimyces CBS 606.96]|uniref:Oxidoreductase-like domain-containing protein n=1 Tax=Capronia epimyces CBS 606.96 TaxID=1182542 RepID=W9Y648_9EURO|nr:uncharacterized protein A1O3_05371 [Capronia epimyces CBS 606.96]EXJ84701.1 hypothetical protein A1O3_05371 [Capronia epimyces CBS 606.96]
MAVPRPLVNSVFKSRRICASCQRVRLHVDLHHFRDQSRQTSSFAHPSNPRSRESRDCSAVQRARRRRSFHSSRRALHEPVDQHRQAVPLGDFYTDLLESPLPQPQASGADTSLPVWVPQGDKTKEERARQVFGALRGSGYERRLPETPEQKWTTVNGVPVPPRPLEPDNCCMSGCVHCVWDDYRDDLEAWAARAKEAQAKAQKRPAGDQPKIHLHRPEVHEASGSMDDDGGGSEALWDSPSTADLDQDTIYQGIPVGIRAFMATEKKIRERKQIRKEKGLKVDDY